MNLLLQLLAKAFGRGSSIEEIISPMRRIAANLAAYEKQKAEAAAKAEAKVAELARQITDDMAEARRAGSLSRHYRLLVDGLDDDDFETPTAVAAE